MAASDSLNKLVEEGRNLRDHLLRLEGQDGIPLTNALSPFDRMDDYAHASDKEIEKLSLAFQSAFDLAQKVIDERTLNNILTGHSPHLGIKNRRERLRIFTSNFTLAILAFFLVVTAFHYSYWANRTIFTIAEAEEFVAFNHFGHINKLVELENYFEQNNTEPSIVDLEPQLIYLEEFAVLEAHYHSEVTLPSRMLALKTDFNPAGEAVRKTRIHLCQRYGPKDGEEMTFTQRVLLGCAPPPVQAKRQDTTIEDPIVIKDGIFRQTLAEVANLQTVTMTEAGRVPRNGYVQSRYKVVSFSQDLRERLNIVHLWALPIIYGALGSVVFSIWCLLNPNVSGLGLFHSLIRMIFAGLAALTFSMLLVPSNILAVGVDLNRPLIYLLSFIFGYSIEAFVNTLNLLNTYFANNIAARKKQQQ